MRILVVGAGSVGKRHLKNLAQVGVREFAACDMRSDRLEEVKKLLPQTEIFGSLEAALETKFDGAVIATPPHLHLKIGLSLVKKGIPLLIEKPLAHESKGIPEFLKLAQKKKVPVFVGYTYRFWPPLLKLKELLDQGVIGKILTVRVMVSEYLPDWHPWEDYRTFFMAKKEQGGGALLDESHMIDFSRWLFGDITEVFGVNGTFSSLEITSDDLAELIVKFKSGAIGNIHMDIYGRAHQKDMNIIGEEGNIIWDYHKNTLQVFRAADKKWETINFTCERNDMFIEEARRFLKIIERKEKPVVDGWDGLKTLKCVEAVRASAKSKKMVPVPAK